MREITLEELLEAGCHFGHQVTRSNPKARDFIFEARDNIHIIDLAKTKEGLDTALGFVKNLGQREGSTLLIVGTKRQAKGIVEKVFADVAEKGASDGLYYVTNRWIGGLMTNFPEVAKNFKKLKDLSAKLQNEEEQAGYTKKEVGLWEKEKNKLESFYGGVAQMQKVPDALFIIDTHLEDLAVKESKKTGVTTVGIVDTNADPALIDYPIPANDDAVGSLELLISLVGEAWAEGRKQKEEISKKIKEEEEKAAKKKEEKIETAPKEKVKSKEKSAEKKSKPKAKAAKVKKAKK